ncbi:MAG: MFS transporter [Chloroflexota bacterium]|nr:MFS transporter [Chloroflexota bacterium]
MSKEPDALSPHFRWNFGVFLVDYVCFGIAFAFVNISSVMPAFVGRLTDSAPVVGLVGTVFNGGWLLPQLAVARLINDKPRKKPYMLAGTSGRVAFWIIALALWAGLGRYPTTMLILFFTCLGLFAASDGVASVAWFDILARAIPLKQRGRLIGVGQVISGLAGVGVGMLVRLILDQSLFPNDYALIFTLAGVALTPSVIALALVREPPPENASPETNEQTNGRWLKLLVLDSSFRRLMACRLMVGMMGLATPFYVMHAADVLHLSQGVIGDFVTAQTSAAVVVSVLLGLVSERWGPRYVARIGGAAAIVGPLLALAAHLAGSGWLVRAYPLVYAALGIVNSSWMLGFFNYLLEIAPEGMRPAYVGLSNTLMGVLTLAPMAGGWLLEATSYTVLFGVTATVVAVGFLLTLGLKPPHTADQVGESPT